MERIFKISGREVKNTEKNTSFIACSTKIGDKYYKVKFTKDCETQPKKRGLYDLTVDIDKCSIERGKPYVNKQGYSAEGQATIWVKEVIKLRAYTEEELAEINRAKFEEILGEGGTSETDELPF